MNKTITVKGIGRASARPDYIVISMNLEAADKMYDEAMALAAGNISLLTDVLTGSGFAKEAVKTTYFNVRTDYENVYKKNGSYERVFNGYVVSQPQSGI